MIRKGGVIRVSDLAVRQATFKEIERLQEFAALAYQDVRPEILKEKWEWQYLKNPYLVDRGEKLPVWIAEKDKTIVGQIGTIPVKLKIGHRTTDAVWGVDLIVLPSCRGEGIGRQLIEHVVKDNKCYMAVDMSDTTRRIYDRLGYVQIKPVPVYRKMVHLSSSLVLEYLKLLSIKHARVSRLFRIVPPMFLSKCLAFLFNKVTTVQKTLKPTNRSRGLVEIHQLQGFGAELDVLWAKVQDQYGIIATRDQTFLAWRYGSNVRYDYEAYGARKDGDLRGYIVLRRGQLGKRPLGYIVDMLTQRNDEETIRALIQHAIDVFGDEVESIECASALSEYQSLLKQYGFIKMKESVPYSSCVDKSIRDQMEALKGQWFMTRGDSDWDFGGL